MIRVELDEVAAPVDWTFLYCNDALAALEGYPKDKLLGQRFFKLFPDGDRKWLKPYYEAAYEKRAAAFDSVSEEIGMRSEWTVSGKEAVIRAKNAMELGDEFYAYIIDWLMPDMNGIETVRRIRRVIGDSHPIIILTAYNWSDVEEEAREAGVTAFCEKPLFMSELRGILTQPYQAQRPKEEKKDASRFRGKRILVVEDNELNQEIALTLLREAGFVAEVAENGAAAVEKMSSSVPGQYDLILMDVQMPVMDGYTATKRIRALSLPHCRTIPIIAMTANAFVEDQEKAVEAGMNGYQAKPIQASELLKTIESVL